MAFDQSYSGPEYNVSHVSEHDRVAAASSAIYYAQFVARAKMYVSNIIVGVRSAFSAAALTVNAGHGVSISAAFSAITGSTVAWISATSVGSYHTIALNRTLEAGEKLGVRFTVVTGKAYVSYEYRLLPPTA